jgi:signal transduction histidine kinase
LGLRGMGERTQRIHGELQIRSAPGHGTTVSVKAEI